MEQKSLVDRVNIVVTSQPDRFQAKQNSLLRFVDSLETALQLGDNSEQSFIIGGSFLYRQVLMLVDRWELTLVEGEYAGDTFFPPYEHLIGSLYERVDQVIRCGYGFETYRRI